ncbi:uncharacterized protein CC84DRAFT_1177017 [Paraphaeosphaeria sporulosa]|uniref:Uncharacterized protein n=1 Tax=Paraphaeosphaeria sporulosa TaxID=1460663 RepID=A0A177CCG4_9PLEO|nr:uncharacterized protein CC84DRAFT_1177017 [Paraphaeosphaeria sporulosa]OAG04871.1 hypothetical protein CC84DRAFT_1177017 [Paraphaeosphaeria sporulosa]
MSEEESNPWRQSVSGSPTTHGAPGVACACSPTTASINSDVVPTGVVGILLLGIVGIGSLLGGLLGGVASVGIVGRVLQVLVLALIARRCGRSNIRLTLFILPTGGVSALAYLLGPHGVLGGSGRASLARMLIRVPEATVALIMICWLRYLRYIAMH